MKKDSGNNRQYASPSLKLLFFDEEDTVRTSGSEDGEVRWGWETFTQDRSNTFI